MCSCVVMAPPLGWLSSHSYLWIILMTVGWMFQVMITGSTGRKVLLFRGYMAMSATLALLTVTIYLQVSSSYSSWCTILIINAKFDTRPEQLGLFLSPQSHFWWMPYCSMVLIFIFILCFIIGPGVFLSYLFIFHFTAKIVLLKFSQ